MNAADNDPLVVRAEKRNAIASGDAGIDVIGCPECGKWIVCLDSGSLLRLCSFCYDKLRGLLRVSEEWVRERER